MKQRLRDFIRALSSGNSIFKGFTYASVSMGAAVLATLFNRYFALEGWIWVGSVVVGFVLVNAFGASASQKKAREQAALVDPQKRLGARIEAVDKAFAEAATLMEELRRDLAAQEAARRRLVTEAQHQQQLIGMDREEAEAVRQLILGETRADIARQRRAQWVFFVLGAVVSIPIGVAINWFIP
ncbi:hypothetical protein GCM10022224_090110 [Nonomuraea antimicrobica]|uniref:Holin-X, holin superfamily III n=1 Tax=Nonomuraea antimicrobica TaxID=561173 RepID=A0ABP7E0N1_9ACTN